jgi:uncharacterized Tic20 family protein
LAWVSAEPHAAAPPGWYATAYGWQWWDGRQWYPPAPVAPGGASDEKTLAVLAHLGPFIGGFVLPLVVFLTAKGKPFLRHHACEALNFALTELIVTVVAGAVFFIGAGIGGSFGEEPDVAPGFIAALVVGFLVMVVASVGGMVLAVIGAIKASRLEHWRYPVSIRFVRP